MRVKGRMQPVLTTQYRVLAARAIHQSSYRYPCSVAAVSAIWCDGACMPDIKGVRRMRQQQKQIHLTMAHRINEPSAACIREAHSCRKGTWPCARAHACACGPTLMLLMESRMTTTFFDINLSTFDLSLPRVCFSFRASGQGGDDTHRRAGHGGMRRVAWPMMHATRGYFRIQRAL